MRIPLTILLIFLCTVRLWGGPITIEESSVDRGATIYREKRWFRGGEKIMAESWILEKGTSEPKIHAQMIFVGDISVIAFSRIKELVAVTSAKPGHILTFSFSEAGVLERITTHKEDRLFQSYVRRSDGFYAPEEEPNPPPKPARG